MIGSFFVLYLLFVKIKIYVFRNGGIKIKMNIKRIFSLFLSLFMLLNTSLISFAETYTNIELSTAQTSFYQGVTYEITSKITNLPETQLIENTNSAFNWEISGVSTIGSVNNYYYTKNADSNTYTVSETAKFTVLDEIGSDIVLSSQYGDLNTSKNIKVLQPITRIELESEKTDTSNYVKSTDGTQDQLFINNGTTADFKITCYPLANDDNYTISATRLSSTQKRVDGFSFTPGSSTKPADFVYDLKITPESGYKYQKTIKVTKCVPLTKFTLSTGSEQMESYDKIKDEEKLYHLGFTQDENYKFTPKKSAPSYSNDTFKYSLYSYSNGNLTYSSELEKYITIDDNYNCILNIHTPGTYCLIVNNVSAGDGSLKRNLELKSLITVTESNPITKIEAKDKSVQLFLNAGIDTYDFSKKISVEPSGHTDSVIYMSDNNNIAKVDKTSGLVTAVSSGTTKIYAISEKNPSVVAAIDVDVFVGLSAITGINKDVSVLPAGHSEQLTLTTLPAVHDESINWMSLNPDVLSVTKNGYITANPDYDFEDKDNVIVGITATSQFGKTNTTYVQVIPAVRAENIQATITGQVENISSSTYSCYNGATIKLSAIATGISGNLSNDVLVWKVATSSGNFIDLENATNLFSSIVKNPDNSYNLTPKISDTLTFYCYAVRGGEGVLAESKYAAVGLNVCQKATGITVINPANNSAVNSITISANTTTGLKVSMSPSSAYQNDEFICSSDNDEICQAVKTSPQDFNLIAGNIYGTALITLQSKSGSKKITLKVSVNNNIHSVTISDLEKEYVYTGTRIEPNPTITSNGQMLYKNIDYTLSYSDQINVGIAKVIITGKGNYAGSVDEKFYNIVQKNIGYGSPSEGITYSISGTYNVSTTNNPVAKITVKYNGITLKEGIDYQLICSNNSKAGTATAKVVGMGNYTGDFTAPYEVQDLLSNATVSRIPDQVYNGRSKTPTLTIKYNGRTLKENIDYKTTYSNNINVGEATVRVTGIGHFTSSVTVKFKIVPKQVTGFKLYNSGADWMSFVWNKDTSYSFTGYQIVNASNNKVLATIKGTSNKYGKISKLSYATKYGLKIRAYAVKNNVYYYGPCSSVVSAYTKPCSVSLTKIRSGKKAFSIYWKALNSKISGYQIQYSTNKNFSGAKTVNVTSYKTTSKTISKLYGNKKYYVRVRAYKKLKSGSKTYTSYGSWSKTLTVTTKK